MLIPRYFRTLRPWLCLLLALACTQPLRAQDNVLRYPRTVSGFAERDSYALALLQLALDKAGSALHLQASAQSMEQSRALLELQQGHHVDVVWSMTSESREAQLLPIRIPIDKGLMGWRIALLPKAQAGRLQAIQNLAQLGQLVAGQGHDWPDRQILADNGLPVVPSASYDSLFQMLEAGRFDYFPRALLEIGDEAAQHPNLSIDSHLLLHYPSASYFFVSPGNSSLAATLRRGLERALADGSFDRLFWQTYAEPLRRVQLPQRRILELHNPLLPTATPLQQPGLWLSREQLMGAH
jgi:hypothetical protein